MAITYSYAVTNMTAYPTSAGQENVVFQIYWFLSGTDSTSGLSGGPVPSNTYVTYVAGEPFTPYNQLTQDQIIGWIMQDTPAGQMTALQNQVDIQIAAKTQQQQLIPPWNNPALSVKT